MKETINTITSGAAMCLLLACGSSDEYHYVKVPQELPQGKSGGLSDSEQEIEAALTTAAASPGCAKYFGPMMERALLVITDAPDLTFTVDISESGCKVERGTRADFKPELVIPLNRQNCLNVAKIFEDGQVSDEEAYRIHYATFLPAVRSYFADERLYDPAVAERMQLPNFMHMKLLNPKGYQFLGSTREATATVVNVDGQWMVFPGLQGDPDVRMEVTHEQAANYTQQLRETRNKPQSMSEAKKQLEEIKSFNDSITVYRRKNTR